MTSSISRALGSSSQMYDRRDAGFFAHHGIWALGVRLFRNLTFASKGLLVSTAFVLPVLCLLAWFLVSQSKQEKAARMEATRQHVEIALRAVELARSKEVNLPYGGTGRRTISRRSQS